MASRGTQEGPRGLQEPILRAFGLHFGRLDGPRVRPRGSQGVPRGSQASPGAIQEKILKEFDVGKVFGCNLCTYGKKMVVWLTASRMNDMADERCWMFLMSRREDFTVSERFVLFAPGLISETKYGPKWVAMAHSDKLMYWLSKKISARCGHRKLFWPNENQN